MSLNKQQLTEFVRAVVRFGEISTRSPYVSSYSTGKSGLTFGAFQHDTKRNDDARLFLDRILKAQVASGSLTDQQANSLYALTIESSASAKISSKNRKLIDDALQEQWSIVDEADTKQLNVVMGYVDSALETAALHPNGPGALDPAALDLTLVAEMAMWGNRTNGLDKSNLFLPKMESITREAWRDEYLSQQQQFTTRGESFEKWTAKVENGVIKGEIAVLTGQLSPLIVATDITKIDFGDLGDLMKVFDPWPLMCLPEDTLKYFNEEFDEAQATRSPLVLDLDGNGVSTIGLDSKVYFDHDGNGFAEHTGWVGPEDGILVHDLDSDGMIKTGAELFGNYTIKADGSRAFDGFDALRELDINNDGQIDVEDPAFADLAVWIDANSNAAVDDRELTCLNEVGVKSLKTASGGRFVDIHLNKHVSGSYVNTEGASHQMNDVWFRVDASKSLNAVDVHIPVEIRNLPNIDGIGNALSLHQTMAVDSSGRLKKFIEDFISGTRSERLALLPSIIYAWAGVYDENPTKRSSTRGAGNAIGDARILESLEVMLGRDYLGIWCWGQLDANPHGPSAAILASAFDDLSNLVYSRLMLQTEYGSKITAVSFASEEGDRIVDTKAVFDLLKAEYDLDPVRSRESIVDFTKTLMSIGQLGTQIIQSLREYPCDEPEITIALHAIEISHTYGLNPNAVLNGGPEDDVLSGGSGSEKIYGYGGDDFLAGGSGDDYLAGGKGSDAYLFNRGDGDDVISIATKDRPGKTADILRFGKGIVPTDITLVRRYDDLLLNVSRSGGSVLIANYFYDNGRGLACVTFEDGTEWKAEQIYEIIAMASIEPSVAPIIHLEDGAVTLGELDSLISLPEEELSTDESGLNSFFSKEDAVAIVIEAEGGYANVEEQQNVYFYREDAGNIVISADDTRQDKLVIDPEIASERITFHRSDFDLLIRIRSYPEKSIRLLNHFFDRTPAFRWLTLEGTTHAIEAIAGQAVVDPINDVLVGTPQNDVLLGGMGNDQLYGVSGDDLMKGGRGSDMYRYSGGGNITVDDTSGELDTLVMRNTHSRQDLMGAAVRDGSDLVLDVDHDGIDTATVKDFFLRSDTVEIFSGSSGEEVTRSEIINLLDENSTRSGNYYQSMAMQGENIQGSSYADHIEAGEGDDTIKGRRGDDFLVGGRGNDTYLYTKGDGSDVIDNSSEQSPNCDTLSITGFSYLDIVFIQSLNDLVIKFSQNEDRITVKNWFLQPSAQLSSIVVNNFSINAASVTALVDKMRKANIGSVNPSHHPMDGSPIQDLALILRDFWVRTELEVDHIVK